jgi:hypothetical protein
MRERAFSATGGIRDTWSGPDIGSAHLRRGQQQTLSNGASSAGAGALLPATDDGHQRNARRSPAVVLSGSRRESGQSRNGSVHPALQLHTQCNCYLHGCQFM